MPITISWSAFTVVIWYNKVLGKVKEKHQIKKTKSIVFGIIPDEWSWLKEWKDNNKKQHLQPSMNIHRVLFNASSVTEEQTKSKLRK